MPAQRLASAEFPFRLQQHQRAAVRAYEASPDHSRFRLVLPPGAGKTLIGAEIARRAGRRVLVLVPNTAAQSQWVQQWQLLGTGVVTIAEDRSPRADINVLTYRDIADFGDHEPTGVGTPIGTTTTVADTSPDPDADTAACDYGDAATAETATADSGPDRRQSSNPAVQSLRLSPVGGDFLRQIAAGPPLTVIIDEAHGLAASPGDLFEDLLTQLVAPGHDRPVPIVIALSAISRDGLSPALQEITDRLLGPQLFTASTPLLIRDQALAPFRDLVRFATPTESERNYLKHSADGWTANPSGTLGDQSLIDQVLLRSAAKADAATTILQAEQAARGLAMRAAIITDYEQDATIPAAELSDVLGSTAGSAREALAQVVDGLPEASPVLVTEATVAGSAATMKRLVEFIANGNPKLAAGLRSAPVPGAEGVVSLSGPGWLPRIWLPIVTGWFLSGGTRILVGTPDTLGYGWDAAGLNVLVDLTSATSTIGAVQIRGRALRMDPADRRKSTSIWSVVVVSDDHPCGNLDYSRFVRKLSRFQGADPAGHILAGVAHVDPECGTSSPPTPKRRTAINIRMMAAAARLAELPLLWGVDQPCDDVEAAVLQIRGCDGEPLELDLPQAALRPWARTRGLVPAAGAAVGALLPIISAAPPIQALAWASVGGIAGWGADASSRLVARSRAERRMSAGDTLQAIGRALAQSLALKPAHVDVVADGDDVWLVRYSLGDNQTTVESPGQEEFLAAMEQVLSPVHRPDYLVSRILPKQNATVWHAVPDSVGQNLRTTADFLKAWVDFVSDGRLVDTSEPEGARILHTVRGQNPGNVSVGMRVEWR